VEFSGVINGVEEEGKTQHLIGKSGATFFHLGMDRSREWFDELIQPDIDSITDFVLKIILEHFWVLLFRGANT